MDSSLSNDIFGPLSRKYCLYFYYLSVIGFIFFVLILVSSLYIGITTKRDNVFFYQMMLASLGYIVLYFQNRLLYSMCVNSL